MSRTLHPVLRTGAVTALALSLTATTVLPATAMPVVPDTAVLPVASTTADQPAGETGEDPAVATGQEASEVKGAQEQSLPLGGIDAEALPEVPEAPVVPEAPEVPEVSEAPVTEQPEQTQQPEPSAEAPATEQPEQTLQPEPTDGTGVDEAPADENGAAATDEAEAELMSATLPESGAAVPAPESVDSGTRPSDVVLQDLQVKARSAPAPLEAAVAEEAEALTDSVMDKALSTTQDLEVEKIATLTQPVETMNFIVAGVTWDIEDAGQVTDVSLRVRESSGWTDWNSMEIHAGDEKPNADRVGTEPLISSGADAIQVRLTTVDGESPAGLELDLIDPGTADTDGKLEPASPASPALQQLEGQAGLSAPEAAAASTNSATHNSATASAEFVPAVHPQQGPITGTAQAQTVATNYDNVLKPAIITRAQWGADESLTSDWGRTSTDLKAMYVHHTAGSNNYSASGAYAQIRGIYQYHAVTLDWQDIGYQFLVDKYGKIYQGRRGSIDAPVQGAQAGGFNTDTIGVSAMGNYDVASAPAAMVRAIERVLAWQAYRYDVDPTAQVTLTQSGKGTARWTSGTRTTQNTILGHRDTNLTACPGRYLYAQLPTIRRNVDSSVTSAIRSYGKYQQVQAPPQVVPARQAWTDGKLSIWWNKAPRTDYYKVFRRTAPVGSSSFGRWYYVGQVDGRYSSGSYAVSAGTTTQFAVRAFNDGGHSPLVTVATHTRETVQAPPQVVPARQAWTDGKLSVWWHKAARTDYYKVFRRTAPVGSSSFGRWYYVGQVDGRYSSGSFAVAAGTRTQFAVRAFNDGGYSPLATVATYTRKVQAPPQVIPARQAWTDGKLSIWWNKAPRADYYKVFRRTAPVGSSNFGRWYYVREVDARYSSGSFAVAAGTRTQFAVRAYNDGGYSPLATVATYTRKVQAPPQVIPARQAWTDGKLSVWWHKAARTDYYKVFRRTAPVGSSNFGRWYYVREVDARYSSGSFAVAAGTRTQFAVRAFNDGGYSPLVTVATHTRTATR